MKKTLLIAAAALAASVISSQAQVYSQNIVGYYNVSVPTNGFQLIGHQLDLGDNTNGISTVFSSGLVSDPNDVNNTQIYTWDPVAQVFTTLYYFTAADATSAFFTPETQTGFYDQGGTYYNSALKPGIAAFLYNINNTHSNLTVTLVGTVPQETNVTTLVQGNNLLAVLSPVATNLCATGLNAGNFVGTSDPNDINNDQLSVWDPVNQVFTTLYYFTAADATSAFFTPETQTGFYDQGGTFYPEALPVGSGFFINHVVAGTETWTNVFSFQ